MDSESQDSDEGVELSPVLGDFIDAYPDDFSYNEECRHTPVVEARTVYVLLPKNVPVSRCNRLQWLLQHLNSTVTVPAILKTNNSCTELQIISAIPIKATLCKKNKFLITNRTEVIFLAQSYRFVYCLDMSPSQSTVDFQKGVILYDEILSCFKASVEGLCQQFTVPGNTLIFQPCIYLTVIVNTPFFMSPAQQVLVKGVQVTTNNLHEIINLVQIQFHLLENRIAHVSALAHDQMDSQRLQSEGIVGGLFDLPEKEQFSNGVPMVSPDANFVNMLRYSMLAISLLPENSLSNILVITDGVVAMPDSNIMESLLFQLHYDSIAVSFLKVGSSFHPHCSAGYVAYMDLLHFLSQCTLGTCIENVVSISREPTMEVNIYHELYLLWSFHTKSRYATTHLHYSEIKWGATSTFLNNKNPVLLSKRQTDENVNASIFLLIARRMREGYTVDSVNYLNGFIEVKLSLQWKSYIYIQYNVTSEWPVTRNVAHFEVQISAPYEFLYDITCLMKKESKSTFRQAVIERFWIRLTQLASNDCGLAQQLTSFQNSNVWYTLPESVRSGIPVFILNTNVIHEGCKLALTPRDVSCPKFVYIWQPICQLDTNSWRKWFHTHKMSLILKHDHPLPKHLHLANSSGRFQVVQCRQAATVLYGLLSKWASFILIDNNTYLKLLHVEHEKPPQWFCIIRVSSKLPCALINIGFLTGTPGYIRQNVLDDLKLQLSLLSYHSSPPKSKENICCTLLQKPLEKFLIRYERMPSDFTTVVFPDGTQPPLTLQTLPPSPFTGTLFTTLSRYLYHRRWIWSATHSSNLRLDCTAISRILSTLTKMRIQEGFNFAHSSSGIITMVLELIMDTSFSCVVQYVLFPPHSAHWGEGELYSSSEDDVEPESDVESELQMVTEVWIEPQYGSVKTNNSRIGYLNLKPYYDLADMIKQTDANCIHSLLTLEHISLMCQEKSPSTSNRNGKNVCRKDSDCSVLDSSCFTDNGYFLKASTSQRIQHIPFKFDPISILTLCQQTELLFSMFIEAKERYIYPQQKTINKANDILMENIQNHMRCIHDRELTISQEESEQFTLHVIKRHRNKSPSFCPVSENFNKNTAEATNPQWRCFIKGVSNTHVILTFIPASLKDLKHLVNFDSCNYPIFNFNDSESERASSRGSSCSDVPINAANLLTFPVYVYDCPLSLLVDAYINGGESRDAQNRDIYEDHRYKSEHQQEEQTLVRLTEIEQQTNSSPEPKSEDSDNDSKNSARQHCKALILLHSKCFTMSLFSALHSELYIHTSDVQAAMDQCEEHVYEIDITEYIMTVCGHLKHHKKNNISLEELQMTTPCIELRPLHRLIEERFSATLRKAFNPIPTNSEYYYCRNLITEKSEEKHDSDDEVSNHPSETVEFQSSGGLERLDSSEIPEINPLFLHLICTVHYHDEAVNTPVKVLPTCLGEIIGGLKTTNYSFEKCKLRITLDILCLTLPADVHNVVHDFRPKGLRATSFCSDFQHSGTSPISEKSFISDFKESDPTAYLPDLQKQAIVSLKDEIKWLLVDEVITSLLDIHPVNINRLNYVMKHVTDNASTRSSCIQNVIDLSFVYGSNKSFGKFIEEFSKLKLPPYTLRKECDVYYLAKELCERREIDGFAKPAVCNSKGGLEDESGGQKNVEVSSQMSDTSSLGGSPVGTDGGYEEDVSDDDEEDYEWLLHMDSKRPHLPNFWLIMQIEQNAVTIYFHCRFLELQTTLVSRYLAVQRAVSDAVRELCKRVNQSLLLQSLYETRHCHHLLEADDSYTGAQAMIRNSSYSRLKSMDEASDEYENYPPDLAEANFNFKPGYFSCPVVWETPFVLHPRLKTGPGKSGISRGILALKNILDKFSVANRDNMFVYQDKNSNVFYLRLHEDIQGTCCKTSIKSNEYEHSIVSRSPSIASLPLGQNKSNMTQSEATSSTNTLTEIRPRVRSFGEKESNEPPNEDTLILRVHGVTEAGEDVKCELVQVLQNRLDDAVLEFLSVMLARNAMCPLTPEDVHFLQKPFRTAEIMIRISMQDFALKFLDSYMHYLRQNLLQFLNIPKYTDSRSHFHFKDYSETEQLSNRMKEDNIFIYNQSQNPSSGSIGIACIALAIICRLEDPSFCLDEKCEQLFENKNFEKMVSANIIDASEGLPDSYLEFRLWKQGRVNMDNLSQKLRNATSQAVWDIIMEHYLLQSSLCNENTTNVKNFASNKLMENTATSCLTEEDSFVDFENTDLLDLSLSSRNIEIEVTSSGLQIETRSDSVSSTSRRRKRLNPQLQRSTTVDETKESASKKIAVPLNAYEQGDRGALCDVYSKTLQDWLEFGYSLTTPAVKRHQVTLTNRHLTNVTVKELQSIITHLSRETAKAFRAVRQENGAGDVYISYAPINSIQKCLIISRNFEQWKACTAFKGSLDFPELYNVNNIKHTQKFTPTVAANGVFIPRQKILWALVETDKVLIYTYNWSKDNVDKLLDYSTNLGMWLSVRASFLNSVTAQKIGLFHNQTMTRKEFLPLNNPYIGLIGEGDQMLKFPKDRLRRIGATTVTNPPVSTLEAFRDCFKNTRYGSLDPVFISTIEMHEIKHCDKKYRESLKKLHAMYQTRTNATTMQQIQILMQNSRIVHYCHTPLLFSPRWRIKSAATRDHSLIQLESAVDKNGPWHKHLCYAFVSEYRRYLQTLGFTPLVLDNFAKKGNKSDVFQYDSVMYIRKAILGGILLFTVKLEEPFVTTKLYVIECNRLQSAALKASINRFTLTFLDECDRVKILMHLHSFAYDFHLRAIYNYLANQTENKIYQGYHLTHFLDDFMKYYNKAPNFARNLVYADTLTIRNLMTEGKQLFDYLLTNVPQYNFEVFDMQRDDVKENEYVLVQVTNTHQVSYKDSQDRQHVDDFDMTIIVCNLCSPNVPRDNVLHLKYYLILISRRDIYPKSEVERTLGKFQTVTHLSPTLPLRKPDFSAIQAKMHNSDTECETSGSTDVPSLSLVFDETRTEKSEKRVEDSCSTIKQEPINYLGYFSSHEQAMRQLILDCAYMTQKQIKSMVAKGMVHCRTHLLWNKLVSCQESSALTYAEFMELKGLAKLENLSDMHPNLGSLLNQPLTWYQGLAKLLLVKYADHNRVYMSTDGNIIHYVILHQRYVGAFMLLSVDSHTSRGDLYAVYREPQKYEESEMCIADRKILLDGFINCVCFYIWSNMI